MNFFLILGLLLLLCFSEMSNATKRKVEDKDCPTEIRTLLCSKCTCNNESVLCTGKMFGEDYEEHGRIVNWVYLCGIRKLIIMSSDKQEFHWSALSISKSYYLKSKNQKEPFPEIEIQDPVTCICGNVWLLSNSRSTSSKIISKRLPPKLVSCANAMRNSSQTCESYRNYTLASINFDGVLSIAFNSSCTNENLLNCPKQAELYPKSEETPEGYRCSISSLQGCLYAAFYPFYEIAPVILTNESLCERSVTLAPNNTPGWFHCSAISKQSPPRSVLVDVYLEGPPIFLDFNEGENHGNYYAVFKVAGQWNPQPNEYSIHWWYWSSTGRNHEFWRILPNENNHFLLRRRDRLSAWENFRSGWSLNSYVAIFGNPQTNCNFGRYTVEACRTEADAKSSRSNKERNCASKHFTIENALPNCAKKNVTFIVADSQSRVVFAEELTSKFWEQLELLPLELQSMLYLRNESRSGNHSHQLLNLMDSTEELTIPTEEGTNSMILMISVAVTMVLACALIVGLVFTIKFYRYKRAAQGDFELQPQEASRSLMWNDNLSYSHWISVLDQKKEIPTLPLDRLKIANELGEGAFGRVYLVSFKKPHKTNIEDATARLLQRASPLYYPEQMALKMVKFLSNEKLRDLEREATVLTSLTHQNIVKFYGICYEYCDEENREESTTKSSSLGDNLLTFGLLFEFMENGSLVHYLRGHNPHESDCKDPALNFPDQLKISLQIAQGLEYLASRHLVHRDLAARNCLVGADLVVKISDFGMTRDICVTDYYKMGKDTLVPLRWLPPESILYRKFTVESDVWSFGVLLWEVFSYGTVPWYMYSNYEVMDVVKEGRILSKTEHCPEVVYRDLIMRCWNKEPKERLTATAAKDRLEYLLEASIGYCSLSESI